MAVATGGILVLALLSFWASSCGGLPLLSTLPKTLIVTASNTAGQVLHVGTDKLTVTWKLNQTLPKQADATYATIKLKLCYAPVSQVGRKWRKTVDNLAKDKTCQFKIVARPYSAANGTTVQSFNWTLSKDLPTATYFVRAYAYNKEEKEVAFGQTTNANKTSNLFEVHGITGRTKIMDIASYAFSGLCVLALVGFHLREMKSSAK